jgi:DNA-nicking Smr family endonuclease
VFEKSGKIPKLDLHGVRHADVEKRIDSFIFDNQGYAGTGIIITGKSYPMKQIVLSILKNYSFDKIQIDDIINTGYIKICF